LWSKKEADYAKQIEMAYIKDQSRSAIDQEGFSPALKAFFKA
jgi:hypothetical protein